MDDVPFKIEWIRWVFKLLEYYFIWKTVQTIVLIIVIDIVTKGGIVYGLYSLWQWIAENDYINKAWAWFQETTVYPYLV